MFRKEVSHYDDQSECGVKFTPPLYMEKLFIRRKHRENTIWLQYDSITYLLPTATWPGTKVRRSKIRKSVGLKFRVEDLAFRDSPLVYIF